MITLQRPDPRVGALLGENKGIKAGDFIKPSQFAIPLLLGGKQVVLNTFTRQCIETKLFRLFQDAERGSTSIQYDRSDEELNALIRADFLVKCDIDEAKRYGDIITLLRRMLKKQEGYGTYTILPTMACNARCIYCYEAGAVQESMTDEVVEQTVQYIKQTCRKNAPINLNWFGGEPLLGEKVIDRICERMREENIKYRASIVSNGSLVTAKLAEKMKRVWHISNIQITLDGREEVYCERKQYLSFIGSPYRAVLDGIHEMLKQGIRVRIRLNVEEENLEEMYALIEELEEEFTENEKVLIYSHSIFPDVEDTRVRDDASFYDALDKLEERLWEFNRKRSDSGNQLPTNIDSIAIEESTEEDDKVRDRYYDKVGALKRYYCMADNPSVGPVIMPNGKFCICEHVSEVHVVGNIFDQTPIDKGVLAEKKHLQDPRCRNCPFLPICTDYSGCPAMGRDCRREMLAIERRSVDPLTKTEMIPPILLLKDGRRVLVKEPTREFAEAHLANTLSGYQKADIKLSQTKYYQMQKDEKGT